MHNYRKDQKQDVPTTFIVVTTVYAFLAWGLFIAVIFA